jgi:hypothetical protein
MKLKQEGLDMLDEKLKSIADEYVEPGIIRGFDKVWPDCEERVTAELEHESVVVQAKLPRRIEQAEKDVRWHEKFDEYLKEEMVKAKRVMLDRWSRFYCWITSIVWWSVAVGEMFIFPWFYRNVFDVPLHIGAAFSPLFPAASLFVKFIHYDDLSEEKRRLFRRSIFWIWLITLAAFSIPFLICRTLVQEWQRHADTFSLSDSSSGFSWLFVCELLTMIALWLWGMASVIGMAIVNGRFRAPATRVENLEKEIQTNKGRLQQATEVFTNLSAELKTVTSKIKCQILAVKSYLQNVVFKQKEDRRMNILKAMHPYLFQEETAPSNGKTHASAGAALALIGMLLAGAMSHAQAQDIFFVQDVSRTSVEQDFQGLGQVVLAMPAGATITLFGSDGAQWVQGSIEDTYEAKQLRQRQALVGQARPFYQRIQARPSTVRDYATVLADILPRVTSNSLLIVQGRPLYRLDPVNWDEKIPSVSWAFHADSPFGERALAPAPARFRAAVIFSPGDFVSPNHRSEIQRFLQILIGRLNGALVLFTTDARTVAALVSRPVASQRDAQPGLPPVSEAERRAPLKLTGATRLGVAEP